MMLLFKLIIITSIWVLGIKIATQEEMVFEKLGKYAEEKKGIWEPLVFCVWCMPSVHSLVGYGFAVGIRVIHYWGWNLVFMYPLVVMGASLVSGLIWNAYINSTFKKIYYENGQKYYYHSTKKIKHEKQDSIKE